MSSAIALTPVMPTADSSVSVVICCYGQAHFLADAIESVLGQMRAAVEVIVVDDGSPDDAAEVAARYPDVHLVRQDNKGLPAARNAGLAVARGDYVAFLDADDVLRPDAVAAGLAAFAGRPDAGFVAGSHVRVDRYRRPLSRPHTYAHGDEDPLALFLRGNGIGMHGAVLYRRDALAAVGGFDATLRACEDYDLYLRLSRIAPVVTHDRVVAEYRWHGHNMSRDSVFMLDVALQTLHRHAADVRDDARYGAAYRAGVRYWTNHYVNELLHRRRMGMTVTTFLGEQVRAALVAPRPVARFFTRRVLRRVGRIASAVLPRRVARRLRRAVGGAPPVGTVRMGDLRRVRPFSDHFGFDRGRPVDRHYIEAFLASHADDIAGRVLEIGDAAYTRRFGGDRVTQSDVLHVHDRNPEATLVGDLADGDHLPWETFDCIVCTQTLQLIYDVRAAVMTLVRMLAPGGVLLVTVPGITQIDRDEWGAEWCWSFTSYALERLLRDGGAGLDVDVSVSAHGNVLAATAFLHGLADVELTRSELDHTDPAYPVIVTARVTRR